MKYLVFTLKQKLEFTLDMSPIVPNNLVQMDLDKIKKIKLLYGKKTILVNELFNIKGTDYNNIIIEKSCKKLNYVGNNLDGGSITVKGNVGYFLGQSMKNGVITVNGNTNSWVGNNMSGGSIHISGNSKNYIGAGLPGDAFGMNNGLIHIKGNAGDRIGDRMRKGIIIIEGNSGDFLGSRIHAGTIISLGKTGNYPGEGMRRGSIILARKPSHISATFKSCGNLKMQFLRLLFTQLSTINNSLLFFKNYKPIAHRFSGDLARRGKGEIIVLKTIKKL